MEDKRLVKYVGATMLVIEQHHPHYHCVGVGDRMEEAEGIGMGLVLNYEDGTSGFIFSAAQVKVIDDEKDKVLTPEEIIEQLAGCNYGPKQIATYLELPEKVFLEEWRDLKSKVRYHYERGRLMADFEVNQKLLANAKTGNITAAQIFFKSSKKKQADDIKAKLFQGFETPEITDPLIGTGNTEIL